ncbi:hypothetical protein [Mangrovihabitans endophyticus]|uniref:Uncharacterized protein n=1 Tax=Mangrovihabitans endophyticus TaxID=1751298 RepID=A0A8J3FRR1_9ACTN|nr:hypothetical protein [Mangrovihabitans endophyticus]GGL18314.1 hypothetical protein GCM10012284_61140 [Mangrovihabitans endophyticus]
MTSLPDAERDASDVVQALAGLAALLGRPVEPGGIDADEVNPALAGLVEDGGAAAARVLAYLRSLRRPGDGEAARVPPRLGPWRDWTPVRGHLFGVPSRGTDVGELPQPRRADPGE